jgi:hypothetical protein
VFQGTGQALEEFLSQLALARETSQEQAGVEQSDDRNIVKNKDEPTSLDTRQQGILKQIATIFGEVLEIGRFQKGPIAKRLDTDTPKLNNKVATVSGVPAEKESKTSSLLDKALIAGGAIAIAYALFDELGSIGRWLSKTSFKTAPKIIVGLIKGVGKMFGYISKVLKSIGNIKVFGKILEVGETISKFSKTPIMVKVIDLLKDAIKGPALKLLKGLKFLPVIGGLINFGFAISRFKNGEVIPGIVELISGIFSIASIFSFGAGGVISAILDGVLLLYDLNKEKAATGEPLTIDENSGILDKMKYYFVEKISPVLRYIPVISSLFYWADSLQAFQSGDTKEGLKQLGYGFLALAPIPGIVKGLEFVMSFFNSKKDDKIKDIGESDPGLWSRVGDMMRGIWDNIVNKGKELYDAAVARFRKIGEWISNINPFNKKDQLTVMDALDENTSSAIRKSQKSRRRKSAKKTISVEASSILDETTSAASQGEDGSLKIDVSLKNIEVSSLSKINDGTEKMLKFQESVFKTEQEIATHELSLLSQINNGIAEMIHEFKNNQQSQRGIADNMETASLEEFNLSSIRDTFLPQTIPTLYTT